MSKKTLTSSSGRLQEVYSASTAAVAVSDASIFTSDASTTSMMHSESCSHAGSIAQDTLPSTQYQKKKKNGLMRKFLGIFKRKRKGSDCQTQRENWKNLQPVRVGQMSASSYEENQSGRRSQQFYDDQVESDSSLPDLVEDDERFNQHSYQESSVIDDDLANSSHPIIPLNIESENTSFVQPREFDANESKAASENFQTHMLNVQVTYNGYGLSAAQKKWLGQQVTGLVNILLDKQSVPKNMSFADDRDPPTFVPEYHSARTNKASKFKHPHRFIPSSNDSLTSFNENKDMSLPRPASRVESNVKVEIEDEVKASGPGHGNIHEPLSTSVMIGGTQKTDTSKLDSDRCTFVDCNDVREDFSKKLVLSEATQHSPYNSSVLDMNASPGPCQDKGMTPTLDTSGSCKPSNLPSSNDSSKSLDGLFRFQDCQLDGVKSFMFTPSKNLMDFSLSNSSYGSAKDSPCFRSRNVKKIRSQTKPLIRGKEGFETSGLSQYLSGSAVLKKHVPMHNSVEQANTNRHSGLDRSPGSDLAFRRGEEISFAKSSNTPTRVSDGTDDFQSEYQQSGATSRNCHSPTTSPTLKRRKTALHRVVKPSVSEQGSEFEVTKLVANVSNDSLAEMSPDQFMKRVAAHRHYSSERLNAEKTATPKPRVHFWNDGNVLDNDATKKRLHFESRLAELQGVRASPASRDDSKLIRFRGSQPFDASHDFGSHRRRSIPVSNSESNAMSPFLVSGQQRWSLSPAEINAVGCYYPEEIANWSGTGPFMSNVSSPRNFHIVPMLPYPTGFSGNVRGSTAGGSSENLALPASDEKAAIKAGLKMKDDKDSAEAPKRRKWRQCLSEKDDEEVWWMPQEWANDRGIGKRHDGSNENKERELEIAKDANIEKIRMNRFVPL